MTLQEFSGERAGGWTYDEQSPLGPPGGFGSVYAGRAADGSPVAVKVVARLGLSERLRRREIEIADKLQSVQATHLLRTLDYAVDGDRILLVLERAERSLAAHQQGAALTEADALPILLDIAAGLQQLHEASVIHRDLKPGNVLLHDGAWKLADFGIARDADLGTQTETFLGAGTREYMAPELWRPTGSPTAKSDLYALGCIAHELLTGQPPFPGPNTADFKHQHETQQPAQIGCSVGLKGIIDRLLAKTAAMRQQSAATVVDRLRTLGSTSAGAQQRIRDAAAARDSARAKQDTARAAQQAAIEARHERQIQALSDLDELCADVHAMIDASLPGTRLDRDKDSSGVAWMFRFINEYATLVIDTWPEFGPPDTHCPPIVLAGSVSSEDLRYLLANVACEDKEDRLEWYLYRFQRGLVHPNTYRYGPPDRPHGLSRVDFDAPDERAAMGGALHVWTLSRTGLTPEVISDLFAEVLRSKQPPR